MSSVNLNPRTIETAEETVKVMSGIQRPFLLVFLMLAFSLSPGMSHFTSPLDDAKQETPVLVASSIVHAAGYQEGSIFTQPTLAIGGGHVCSILDNRSLMCWGEGSSGQLGDNQTSSQSSPVYVADFGPGRTASAITAGFAHTCALLDNGSVTCWGEGSNGQLGDGANTDSSIPSPVVGFPSNQKAITISSGHSHTCALLDDGAIACWGKGSDGQLGNGGTSDSSSPTLTDSLGSNASAKAISSGTGHTCAITNNGSTLCWGQGNKGQLGNGLTSSGLSPLLSEAMPFDLKAVALAAAGEHTCALLSQGSVACWGNGASGKLGDSTTADRSLPEMVAPFGDGRKAVSISATDQHTCAVLNDGNVSCWGSNQDGRGGDGGVLSENTVPTDTGSLGGGRIALSITSGYAYSCVILDDISVACWGDLDPLPGSTPALTPSELTLFPTGRTVAVSERDFNGNGVFNIFEFPVNFDFTASGLSAGAAHTCAILDDDSVTCWGDNSKGQLGTGDTQSHSIPITTLSLGAGRTAQAVVAGHTQTCALLDNGSVSCWGEQYLTNDTKVILTAPTLIGDFGSNRTATHISSGLDFSCAVLNDGNVSCWGRGASGRLGNGGTTSSTDPTPTSSFGAGRKAVSVDLYSDHACALIDDGSVMCWGRNDYGKLGDGTTAQRTTPVQVNAFPTNTTPIAVSVGSHHSCALLDIGDVSCWGEGGYGQNGDGTSSNRASPGRTSGFGVGRLAVSVSSGDHHICAMLDSGEVACWGDGGYGRLGNGGSSTSFSPVITGTFGEERIATSLSVGSYHGCVVLNSGQISCWGRGGGGQLGNGETSNQASPVLTKTLGPSVSSISAGGDHSCALLGNGSVACWGAGRVGDGRANGSSVPVLVSSFGAGRTAVQISSGNQGSCAILDNGSVSCWGYGDNLGNGFVSFVPSPTLTGDLGAGRTAVDLSLGGGHSCAVLDNGSVSCWGVNLYGQLGDATMGTGDPKPSLTGSFGAGRTAVSVTTGIDHSCALLDNGSVSCWGQNEYGQLGTGDRVAMSSPTLIAPFDSGRTAVDVSAGRSHTCALLDNGQVSCWGQGSLGHGSIGSSNVPLTITHSGGISNAVSISAGYEHSCAALSNGSAMCWGSNNYGALGIGDAAQVSNSNAVLVPSSLDSNRKVVDIVAGVDRTCVIYDNQSVACTGKGTAGQIGNNDTSNQVNFTYTIPMVVPRSIALDSGDQDGDGVADPLDAYPEDITRTVRCVVPLYGRYACTTVGIGKYVPNEEAMYPTDAAVGHYVDRTGQATQRPCPVGRYNPSIAAESISDCFDSDPGHYVGSIGQGSQTPCDVGTYEPNTRSAECLPSGLGHFVNLSAQTNHIPCAVGTFQNQTEQTSCLPAERGHYANETGQINQTACLEGFYNPSNGSIMSSDCGPADIGHFVNETGRYNQTECFIGSLQNQTGQSVCVNASRGHYVDLVGQWEERPCLVGTYNPVRGSNNSTACLPSTRGHFVNETGQAAQTPCQPGTYNPVNGSTDPNDCLDSDVGHFVEEPGQWNQTPCNRGTFQNQSAQSICGNADPGHFVNATGQSEQEQCAPGSFQPYDGQWRCLPAGGGHYVPLHGQANQSACEVGTYNPNMGSMNATDCIGADAGHFVNITGQEAQTPCAIGTYNPNAGSTNSSACMNASRGYYVDLIGQTSEIPCPSTTFNPSTGGNASEACQWSLRGTYVDQPGQSEGIPCPIGTYNPAPGAGSSDACQITEAGTYVDTIGQSSPTLCRLGTYNPDVGSTSESDCEWADINHYVAELGQTKQTPCPPGMSQPKPGQAICVTGDQVSDVVDISPDQSFQLIFILLTACMLAMGLVLYRRIKNKRNSHSSRSRKAMSSMQRRYKY
jgi:alpha-tubulin suppressor-like RCC1 family protein